MNIKIFDLNDIIIITMKMIENVKKEALYRMEEDTLEIPQHISNKLDIIDDYSCEELFNILEGIVDEIYNLKSGELHELNLIHKEVMILSEERLKKYIK